MIIVPFSTKLSGWFSVPCCWLCCDIQNLQRASRKWTCLCSILSTGVNTAIFCCLIPSYSCTMGQWNKASWRAKHFRILNCGYWKLAGSSPLCMFPVLSSSVTAFTLLCSFGLLQLNWLKILVLFLGMEKWFVLMVWVICSNSFDVHVLPYPDRRRAHDKEMLFYQ